MFFRAFQQRHYQGWTWYAPIARQHCTVAGAIGEVWQEAYNRFPFSFFDRASFVATAVVVREDFIYPPQPPIAFAPLENSVTLSELITRGPCDDCSSFDFSCTGKCKEPNRN